MNKGLKMVMARLHLICGNCGCGDDWDWRHHEKEVCNGETIVAEDVTISCRNCATNHSLNDKGKKRPV